MRRKEPWAQHALAHVFLTRGRMDEGALFLEEVADTWSGLNSFMLSHIWWHLALFYLSQGRDAEAASRKSVRRSPRQIAFPHRTGKWRCHAVVSDG
jgi:ATP/maltotriose-dependent transcriptional regulator MalT